MQTLDIKIELQDGIFDKLINALNSFNGLEIKEIKQNKLLKKGKLKTRNAYDLLKEL